MHLRKKIGKIRGSVRGEKALGLVEALVAIAVVGSGMVIITSMSLRSMKLARKNEIQDVAIEAAVEAMDFMKDPGSVVIKKSDYPAGGLSDEKPHYFRLDVENVPPWLENPMLPQSDLQTCDSGSGYLVGRLKNENYIICQQIMVKSIGQSKSRFDIEVTVVWQTVGGDIDKRVISGYRYGDFIKSSP